MIDKNLTKKLSGKRISNRRKIMQALAKYGKLSSRQLVKYTGLERCSITNPLNTLENENLVQITIDICKHTGRQVKFYEVAK